MELDARHPVTFHHAGKLHTVGCRCDAVWCDRRSKRMGEVDLVAISHAFQQPGGTSEAQTVPADMGDLESIGRVACVVSNQRAGPAHHAQTGYVRGFLTPVEQPLKPQTDAQQRHAVVDRIPERVCPVLGQRVRRLEVADPRDDHTSAGRELLRRGRCDERDAEVIERLANRCEVAGAVVAYPGIALAVELYREAGIRAVEIGSVMFGNPDAGGGREQAAPNELVRLAIPRRVYTQSHIDYVVEAIINVFHRRDAMAGYRIIEQPPLLRHFSAHFAPL